MKMFIRINFNSQFLSSVEFDFAHLWAVLCERGQAAHFCNHKAPCMDSSSVHWVGPKSVSADRPSTNHVAKWSLL